VKTSDTKCKPLKPRWKKSQNLTHYLAAEIIGKITQLLKMEEYHESNHRTVQAKSPESNQATVEDTGKLCVITHHCSEPQKVSS
jgi:hypothetical protein